MDRYDDNPKDWSTNARSWIYHKGLMLERKPRGKKGVLKSKVMLDLHFLMKRGKILGKALNEIIVQQHNTLSCISQDVHMSFISPREYEFSCSGSPAYKFYSHKHPYYRAKRRKLLDHYKHARFHAPSQDGDDLVSSACGGDAVVEASPFGG
ncbi:hypothetical protein OIU77_005152, partial [Salix suchowensis]